MIQQFGSNTALLLIDVQKGVDDLKHWGGPTGRRNNPDAEAQMKVLLDAWRQHQLPVFFTRHDSREVGSPLKWSLISGEFIPGFEPKENETVIWKDVNSSFIGTTLELELRRQGISRLLVVGFFTNFCVETTVRMAGNLGYDTYLVADACATTNRVGSDGTDYDPQVVHDMSVANMNREFCTAVDIDTALSLLDSDAHEVARQQGNE